MGEARQRGGARPGGRSARVQVAVHRAVRELQAKGEPGELTVPTVAAQAGVTPSTIYRRWGSLAQLLSDVAAEKLRPDSEPEDTGSLRGDLRTWLEQYVEEMSSQPGRAMVRDVLGGNQPENAALCSTYLRQQFESIQARALARGETPPSTDVLLDRIVAPMIYRILFTSSVPEVEYFWRLLDDVLEGKPAAQ
ncbi:TetR family transcriptional regulator [Phyllobacterium phragmitis]|uniref:TetR family transcriptional regulator n=1 Tax=Phyllobacterium phragmitis TaxID=2670329 RepID=A0A2S9IR82_9HYPH|nr:TetR/AcrR family transcriptional regulator [Phyllobacterium phragmitis]PRD43030.1 TetR family transcriptional regulator [Phyllobacterium phragmitis]